MDLAHRRQRLELIFEDGRLVEWRLHAERRAPDELAAYDDEAGWLVVRAGAL
jgi:hypothetical protein